MLERDFEGIYKVGSKYEAPPIPGWRHVGNDSVETLEEIRKRISLGAYYPGQEIRIEPFFPDGETRDELWKYRIKWAIYVRKE